ncbi:MAG TPA: hypothetical protein VIM41_08400 [Gammaproteobacteria bacterium]
MSKIPTDINRSINKKISDLCPFSIAKNHKQNHCAHYVSPMMAYELPGPTCKNFSWADKQNVAKGATLRVDDLFSTSPEVDLLANKPASIAECLVFVTLASNITTVGNQLIMGNHPRKHVGILTNGKVWHYSNTNNKVVTDTLATFQSKFPSAYNTAGTTVEFYYGKVTTHPVCSIG